MTSDVAERDDGEPRRRVGPVTFGAVSQHLKSLEREGVVSCRKEGRQRFYRARRSALGPLAPLQPEVQPAVAGPDGEGDAGKVDVAGEEPGRRMTAVVHESREIGDEDTENRADQ